MAIKKVKKNVKGTNHNLSAVRLDSLLLLVSSAGLLIPQTSKVISACQGQKMEDSAERTADLILLSFISWGVKA